MTAVIYLEVEDPEILIRATGRRTHQPSGRTYHVKYNPPKVADKDDATGESLIQRNDDKEETVKKRLTFFHKVTEQIIRYYDEQKLLYKINGNVGIDEVWKQVEETMKRIYA